MGELSPWHWIIVLLLAAVLFGSKRLPDAARGLGRSMRIFKAEMQSARDDVAAEGTAPVAPDATASAAFATPTASTAPVEDAVPADRIPEQPSAIAPVTPVTASAFATPEPIKPTVDH